jgi:hypothetical protein
MLRARPFAALATIAAVLATTALAHATVVVPLSLADQVGRADRIVRAHVVAMRSAYEPSRGAIFTYTELQVTETLKGAAQPTLLLRQMGGTAGGQTQLVPGDAHFGVGDDVVLFLRNDSAGPTVFLFSLAQSAYFVSGQSAQRDLSQLTFAVLGDQGMQLREPGAEPSVQVDSLLAQIRSLVGGAQ